MGPLPEHVGRYDVIETVFPSTSVEELNAAAETIRRFPDHPDWPSLVAEHRRLTAGSEATLISIWYPATEIFRYSTTALSSQTGAPPSLLDVAVDFSREGWSLSGGQLALLDGARPPPQRDLNVFLPMVKHRLVRLMHGPFASIDGRDATVASVVTDKRSDSDYLVRIEPAQGPAVLIGLRDAEGESEYRVVHWRVEAGSALALPPGAPQSPVAFEVIDAGVNEILSEFVFDAIEGYAADGTLLRREDFVGFTPLGDSEIRAALAAPVSGRADPYRGEVRVDTVVDFRNRKDDQASLAEAHDADKVIELPGQPGNSGWKWAAALTAVGGVSILAWWRVRR